MPGGGPVTLPIEVSVPSSPTRNSSTVPVRPVSTYRKPPLETRSIVPGFVVANLATSYKLTEHATVTARVENLFNEHYEEVAGFGEPGFAMYGGLKLNF